MIYKKEHIILISIFAWLTHSSNLKRLGVPNRIESLNLKMIVFWKPIQFNNFWSSPQHQPTRPYPTPIFLSSCPHQTPTLYSHLQPLIKNGILVGYKPEKTWRRRYEQKLNKKDKYTSNVGKTKVVSTISASVFHVFCLFDNYKRLYDNKLMLTSL